MPELQQKPQRRQVAVKVKVKEIVNGKYVKEEGWLPNYIEIRGSRRVSRVNIIGTIVFKYDEEGFNYKNLVVDDGSGKISVRSFEKNDNMDKLDVGDIILIIGRAREFNNEKYIIPEIMKKIQNPMWMQVRKLEIDDASKNIIIETTNNEIKKDENLQSEVVHEEVETESSDSRVIFDMIKKLDTENGISIDDLIKKSNFTGVEKLINILLRNGDIFEVKPGIVKVLE